MSRKQKRKVKKRKKRKYETLQWTGKARRKRVKITGKREQGNKKKDITMRRKE